MVMMVMMMMICIESCRQQYRKVALIERQEKLQKIFYSFLRPTNTAFYFYKFPILFDLGDV